MADYMIQPQEVNGAITRALPVTYSVDERRIVPYEMHCRRLGIATLGKSVQDAAARLVETAIILYEALTWIPEGKRKADDQQLVKELEKYLVTA